MKYDCSSVGKVENYHSTILFFKFLDHDLSKFNCKLGSRFIRVGKMWQLATKKFIRQASESCMEKMYISKSNYMEFYSKIGINSIDNLNEYLLRCKKPTPTI